MKYLTIIPKNYILVGHCHLIKDMQYLLSDSQIKVTFSSLIQYYL